jgi:hypothetical protein
MDSRTRSGFLAVQFERLTDGRDTSRSVVLECGVALLTLTRHGNVVSCVCELHEASDENLEALRRRGAVDGTFMISPKLPGREFGAWLERLLMDDLGADPGSDVGVLELEPASL